MSLPKEPRLIFRRCSPQQYRTGPESMVKSTLIDGWLIEEPSASPFHQTIQANLFFLLSSCAKRTRAGLVLSAPLDVWLDDSTVVQPDILFIAAGRKHIMSRQRLRGAPDLVVEILSPSTTRLDRDTKRTLYAKHGVREMWLVDPFRRRVGLYRFPEDSTRPVADLAERDHLATPLLPGLGISVAKVFAPE